MDKRFQHYLFLPTWISGIYLPRSKDENAVVSVPTRSQNEANLFSLIITHLQRDALNFPGSELKLNLKKILREVSFASRQSSTQVKSILETISSTRFVRQGFEAISLFESDSWNFQSSDDFEISLRPNQYTMSLLSGYTDAYHEKISEILSELKVSDVQANQPPLRIWKPLWLELSPSDQNILLKMEKASQHERSCVHLNGVFSASILDDGPFAESTEQLTEHLRSLKRIGKKMIEHGLLVENVTEGPYSFFHDDREASAWTVLWQSSRAQLSVDLDEGFVQVVQKVLEKSQMARADFRERLFTFLALGIHSKSLLDRFQSMYDKLANESVDPIVDGCSIANLKFLFFEWWLRQQKGHQIPLSQNWKMSEPARVVQHLNFENCLETWQRFQTHAFESSMFDQDGGSLLGLDLVKDSERVGWIRTAMQGVRVSVEVNLKTEEPMPKVAVPAKSTPAVSSPNIDRAKLKKIASEELHTLFKRSPGDYQALKKQYLESLPKDALKMLRDVEKKMQPSIFEEHIKQRLIHYMMENPGAWKSTTPSVSRKYPRSIATDLVTRL